MKNLESTPKSFLLNWNQSYISPERKEEIKREDAATKKELIASLFLASFLIAGIIYSFFFATGL